MPTETHHEKEEREAREIKAEAMSLMALQAFRNNPIGKTTPVPNTWLVSVTALWKKLWKKVRGEASE